MEKVDYCIMWQEWGKVEAKPVSGYLAAPGLGVHKDDYNWWMLTHIKSGRRLPGYFSTRKGALEAAGEIAKIINWDMSEPEVTAIPTETRKRVFQVLREHADRWGG